MYSVGWINLVELVLLIAIGILGYFIWKQHRFLRSIFPRETKNQNESLLERFAQIVKELESVQKREELLNKNIRNFNLAGLKHIQRQALLRYNPYSDTGGDQSFSVALLDGNGVGVLITSLHTRSGTRIYAKNIKEGKSDLKLSKEEETVLQQALEN